MRAERKEGREMDAVTAAPAGRRIPWKWLGAAAAVVALVVAARMLPLQIWLNIFSERVAALGPAGVVLYAAMYAVAAVLFVPGSVLTLAAGVVFGLFWGTVAVSLGSTAGAALAFLLARYLARERVVAWAAKYPKFRAIDRAIGEQGWKIVALLRLSPLVPFTYSNYLYGLTPVRFWPYVLASWAAMLPGTVLYVYLGVIGKAGLEAAAGAETARSPLETAALVVGLVATGVATWYISRIARRALERARIAEAESAAAKSAGDSR
jgi:uncharacterized membrane protein YdjX (TVP38/TMEM64 family)